MPRAYSVDLRERSLAALASGRSMTEVVQFFGVSRKTLYRWRARQATTGSLEPGRASGRPRRLSPAQEAALLQRLGSQPDLTLAELCAIAPAPVSLTTMSRIVQRHGLRRKKNG
jgi:transposase